MTSVCWKHLMLPDCVYIEGEISACELPSRNRKKWYQDSRKSVQIPSFFNALVLENNEHFFDRSKVYCAKRLLRSSGPPGASVRPSAPPCAVRRRRRPAKSANVPKMDRLKRTFGGIGPAEGSQFWSIFGISPRYVS